MAERYGDFELQRLIATGGMAEIYLAKHGGYGDFSRTVVVKRMLPQLAVRPDFVQMFLDEARLAANLNHPNIVQVFNLGEVDHSYYIAMEFVDGPHLGSLFAHSLRLRRPLPIEQCAYIVARAADGLHYAHERADPATGDALNIVHRDISPQNVLVSRQGDVKVTDFGVAKASTQQTKTRTGIIKGKVSYMSPEQCLGEVVDRRTDVFALGIVLYELLTRRRLFREKSDLLIMQKITGEDVPAPSSVNKDLDVELDAICLRALTRDREARFANAADLSEALDAWLGSRGYGDPRLQLQRWFEANALELSVGAQDDASSPSVATAQVRPTSPGEQTAATPSLHTISSPLGSSALGSSAPGSPAAGEPSSSKTPRPPDAVKGGKPAEGALPARGPLGAVDEPTQRAAPPSAFRDVGLDVSSDTEPPLGPSPLEPFGLELPEAAGPPTSEITSVSADGAGASPPGRRLPMAAMVGGGALGAAFLAVVLMFAGGGGDATAAAGASGTDEPGSAAAAGGPLPTPAGEDAPPSPATASAGSARITIESVPPGVPILLDEERVVGKTPLTFEHAPGQVKLQAQFDDQPPVLEVLDVGAGEERVVRLLAQVPLVVKSSPAKAKVRLDGELLGETPLEKPGLVRPEKKVRVRLELAGYAPVERELTPAAGVPLVVDATLEKTRAEARPAPERKPTFGFLNMRSTPWVNVRVQSTGQKLGATILAQAKVPAGRQTLLLTNPEQGINESLTVVVPEDKPLSVTLEWEKKGNGWKIRTRSIK